MLSACRGVGYAGHPVLRAAHALTGLHERRLTGGRDDHIDGRSAGLIREIDRWVRGQLPPSRGPAAPHTETIGAVIDRIAAYTAVAYAALVRGSDHELDDVRRLLAETAVGYEDLADDLVAGRRRLPGGW
ncbi:DUF4254 domain-containing protein [Nocardia arizonensis]|uniref:DUF4254 domain-containing protein n=1 Tax=Nocardia arizonensis TaxID=1141647 RepID=UPI001EF6B076|nr:DUF4254 domain-containing protein [Nocardia arizonensis]